MQTNAPFGDRQADATAAGLSAPGALDAKKGPEDLADGFLRAAGSVVIDEDPQASGLIRDAHIDRGPFPGISQRISNDVLHGDKENRQTRELEKLIRLSLGCATPRRLGGDNSAYAWLMQRRDSLQQEPADPDRVNLRLLLTSLCEDLDSGHGGSANETNRASL